MTLKFMRLKGRDKITAFLIALGMLACWAAVWPGGVFRDEQISRTAADYSMNTGPIGEVAAIQQFSPRYDRIKSVGVDIGKQGGAADQGILYLHFYDENLNEFAVFPYETKKMNDGTLTDIPVHLRLKAGSVYFMSVQCEDYGETAPALHYRSLSGNGPEENLYFYYGPIVIEDASANIRYIYETPLGLTQILFYDSAVLLLGAALWAFLAGKKGGAADAAAEMGKDRSK